MQFLRIFNETNNIDTFKNIYFINNLISNNGINEIKGNNVKVRLNDGSRAVGKSIIKNNNITVLNDGEYTPCKEDRYLIKNCPGWKLQAKKIYQNNDSKTVHYDHAKIYLFNIPFIYLPYFSHPDPSVNKRSGFLMPTVETDQNLGDTFLKF